VGNVGRITILTRIGIYAHKIIDENLSQILSRITDRLFLSYVVSYARSAFMLRDHISAHGRLLAFKPCVMCVYCIAIVTIFAREIHGIRSLHKLAIGRNNRRPIKCCRQDRRASLRYPTPIAFLCETAPYHRFTSALDGHIAARGYLVASFACLQFALRSNANAD